MEEDKNAATESSTRACERIDPRRKVIVYNFSPGLHSKAVRPENRRNFHIVIGLDLIEECVLFLKCSKSIMSRTRRAVLLLIQFSLSENREIILSKDSHGRR